MGPGFWMGISSGNFLGKRNPSGSFGVNDIRLFARWWFSYDFYFSSNNWDDDPNVWFNRHWFIHYCLYFMDTPWWLGYGGFLKWGYPPNHPSHFTIFVLKPMVLGISIPCIRMLPCIKVRILAADLKPPRLILGPDMGMAGCSLCRSFTYVYGGFLKWGTPKSCKSLLLINGKTNGFGFLCFRKPPYPYQHPSWNMAAMQWKTRVNICTVNKSINI